MEKSKRTFTAEFKTKVVLEVLKERNTIQEIARKYELHPNQISVWKKAFLDNASSVFSNEQADRNQKKTNQDEVKELYSQIGELQVQNNWLKKKLDL